MKVSGFLTIFTAATVSAKCSNVGEEWGDKLTALFAVNSLCHDSDEILAGNFAGLQSKSACANGNGHQLRFTLMYIHNDAGRRIDGPECYDGFRKEIEGCSKGGDTTYGNWRYVANPEAGECP